MSFHGIVLLAFQISLAASVFGYGLRTAPCDLRSLTSRPWLTTRALVAILVLAPTVAVAATQLLDVAAPVEIGLVAFSISPLPPLLPARQQKAGGSGVFGFGLIVVLATAAIVSIPVSLLVIGRVLGEPLTKPVSAVVALVGLTVLVPVALGMLVRSRWPVVAERLVGPTALALKALLPLGAVVLLPAAIPGIPELWGQGSVALLFVVVAAGFVAGHILGGPDPDDRVVLAYAVACRHPGTAVSIAAANFAEQRFAATVLLYLVCTLVIGSAYSAWWNRRQ